MDSNEVRRLKWIKEIKGIWNSGGVFQDSVSTHAFKRHDSRNKTNLPLETGVAFTQAAGNYVPAPDSYYSPVPMFRMVEPRGIRGY